MTTGTPEPLVVTQPAVGSLEANLWNPTAMVDENRAKLVAYIRQEGLVQPLVVRPHPDDPDRYQILGGQHRWEGDCPRARSRTRSRPCGSRVASTAAHLVAAPEGLGHQPAQ